MSEQKPAAGGCPMHASANSGADDAQWHGAQMDFSNAMSYGDYLGLNQILNACLLYTSPSPRD